MIVESLDSENSLQARIIHGDCVQAMKDMFNDGILVDSIVTDPPYHLKSIVSRFKNTSLQDDNVTGQRGLNKADGLARLSRGFMGQEWDGGDIANQVETWEAAYNVLKPGGFLLAFGGTRTFHRMTCAIEDAGFEIRDCLSWMYGTGFPKSHNISKAISEKYSIGLCTCEVCENINIGRDLDESYTSGLSSVRPEYEISSAPSCSVSVQREKRHGEFGEPVPNMSFDSGTKDTKNLTTDKNKHNNQRQEIRSEFICTKCGNLRRNIGGSALKPAWEPIIFARKPLGEKTVAANVLKYGTGGINIDDCRIGVTGATKRSNQAEYPKNFDGSENRGKSWARTGHEIEIVDDGRWPANVIHDGSDEVMEMFGEYGESKDGKYVGHNRQGSSDNKIYGGRNADTNDSGFNGEGTAARFFYSAKASSKDRIYTCTICNQSCLKSEWETHRHEQDKFNHIESHPTCKPISLMRYLVRLVTPPNGTVLDPFAGSGTTLQAAVEEGFKTIGVEQNSVYVDNIQYRIKNIVAPRKSLF